MTTSRVHCPSRFCCRHLEDGVDRLLLRVVDERAGVDDDHVGVGRVGRDLVPGLLGDAQHHLAVDEVLGAAEGEKADLHCLLTVDGSRTDSYGYIRYSIRGYGIASRRCSRPQIQATTRSMPMPKPPCGTLP